MGDALRALFPRGGLGAALAANRGIGPGFDLLRLGLAFLILYGHTRWAAGTLPTPQATTVSAAATVATEVSPWTGYKRPYHLAMVPMFFALSGFLVAASAWRTGSVRVFLTLRGLRIFPALAVEVALCALILGPLLTTLPLSVYFSDQAFYRYFGNIFGFVTFELPGMFLDNPIKGIVNINLWTLTAEFYCYLALAAIMAAGLLGRRTLLTASFGLATTMLLVANTGFGFGETPQQYPSHVLVYYFLAGVLFYLWREKIPLHPGMFFLAGIAAYGLLLFRGTIYLAPVFLVYVTVYVGMMKLPRIGLLQSGDYSYGIYLYGFPISQALLVLYPGFRGHGWHLLAATVVLTLCFAAASWHLIEKHCLKLKGRLLKSSAAAQETPTLPLGNLKPL